MISFTGVVSYPFFGGDMLAKYFKYLPTFSKDPTWATCCSFFSLFNLLLSRLYARPNQPDDTCESRWFSSSESVEGGLSFPSSRVVAVRTLSWEPGSDSVPATCSSPELTRLGDFLGFSARATDPASLLSQGSPSIDPWLPSSRLSSSLESLATGSLEASSRPLSSASASPKIFDYGKSL